MITYRDLIREFLPINIINNYTNRFNVYTLSFFKLGKPIMKKLKMTLEDMRKVILNFDSSRMSTV